VAGTVVDILENQAMTSPLQESQLTRNRELQLPEGGMPVWLCFVKHLYCSCDGYLFTTIHVLQICGYWIVKGTADIFNSLVFVPAVLLGRVAGLGGLDIPHDQVKCQIILLAPRAKTVPSLA